MKTQGVAGVEAFEEWVVRGAQDSVWARQFPGVDFSRVRRAMQTLGDARVSAFLSEGEATPWRRLPAWRAMEEHSRALQRRIQDAERGLLDAEAQAGMTKVFSSPQRAPESLPGALARILAAWLDYEPPDESDLVQRYLEDVARYAVQGVYGEEADIPPFSGETAVGLAHQGVIPSQVSFVLVQAYRRWCWTQWVERVRAHAASSVLPAPEAPPPHVRVWVSALAQIDPTQLRGVYESLAERALRQACASAGAGQFQWLLDTHASGPPWVLRRLQAGRDLQELGLSPPPETQDVDQLRSWVDDVWKDLDMNLAGASLEILGWGSVESRTEQIRAFLSEHPGIFPRVGGKEVLAWYEREAARPGAMPGFSIDLRFLRKPGFVEAIDLGWRPPWWRTLTFERWLSDHVGDPGVDRIAELYNIVDIDRGIQGRGLFLDTTFRPLPVWSGMPLATLFRMAEVEYRSYRSGRNERCLTAEVQVNGEPPSYDVTVYEGTAGFLQGKYRVKGVIVGDVEFEYDRDSATLRIIRSGGKLQQRRDAQKERADQAEARRIEQARIDALVPRGDLRLLPYLRAIDPKITAENLRNVVGGYAKGAAYYVAGEPENGFAWLSRIVGAKAAAAMQAVWDRSASAEPNFGRKI